MHVEAIVKLHLTTAVTCKEMAELARLISIIVLLLPCWPNVAAAGAKVAGNEML